VAVKGSLNTLCFAEVFENNKVSSWIKEFPPQVFLLGFSHSPTQARPLQDDFFFRHPEMSPENTAVNSHSG
jgi:hypothetical protein